MLYIVSTPIGNLEDITVRAIKTLQSVSYILAEDTRVAQHLLYHYKISTPLISYHKFSENKKLDKICEDLSLGKNIALISDAGTPLIQDPGEILIHMCIKKHLPFTSIGGVCSPILALTLSGFPTTPFQCIGFFPKKRGEIEKTIQKMTSYAGVSLAFVTKTQITQILPLFPSHTELALCREMTKLHETVYRGKAHDILQSFAETSLRGEMVLVTFTKHIPDKQLQKQLFELLSTEFPKYKAERLAKKWSNKLQ